MPKNMKVLTPDDRLLTVQEVADRLSVNRNMVWRYMREKGMPFIQLGDRSERRVPESALSQWLLDRLHTNTAA